jgi:hypothetical protein
MLDVRIKHMLAQGWKISLYSQPTLLFVKKIGFRSDFPSVQSCGCFLFVVDGHLLTPGQPLVLSLSLFFSVFVFLCLVFVVGSVASRWYG